MSTELASELILDIADGPAPGSDAELVGHGLRETRCLGRAKRRLQRLWTAGAVNLKRLFKLAETRSGDLAAACNRVHSQRPAGRPTSA